MQREHDVRVETEEERMKRARRSINLVFCVAALWPCHALAQQQYPTKPIRVIVPWAPGGSGDTVVRVVSQKLTDSLRQQLVVDNRPGANGHLGLKIASESLADGYTIVHGYISSFSIDPTLHKSLPYDPAKDFAPITQLVANSNVLVVHPSVPTATLKELIAYAKANPRKINFGSSGIGSIGHLTGELLNQRAGIDIQHVQYKGGGQAVIAVVAGEIHALFSGFSSTLPHITAGRLRPLAVTSAKRSSILPNVPTISEAGLQGVEATAWHGLFAPAGTPKAVIQKLHGAVVAALAAPDVKERLARLEFDIVGSSPEAFSAHIQAELRKWAPIVKASGAKAG